MENSRKLCYNILHKKFRKKNWKCFKEKFNPDLPKDFASPGESGLIKTLSTINLKKPSK